MQYRLKSQTFLAMDGPRAGRRYERGQIYNEDEIPPEELPRFELVSAAQGNEESETPDASPITHYEGEEENG
ncbi:MAG: hypothetical protein HGA78_01165 [Nitrospirales bacterium]|nr:hypothetical protein [Nitrospirales bacterium]